MTRIAHWINLGTVPYQDVYRLQETLAEWRKQDKIPDTILAVQHPVEINFGTNEKDNQFSSALIRAAGSSNPAQIQAYLRDQGIRFSKTARGGGATVLAPGQLVYYPIVKHAPITGKSLDVGTYKSKIYRVLFESLRQIGVHQIGKVDQYSDTQLQNRNDRRDIWLEDGGISYKLGSKGLRFSGPVAYHGFVLYADAKGIQPFWMVHPCGFTPADNVRVSSIEDVLKRPLEHAAIDAIVKNLLQEQFNYTAVIDQSPYIALPTAPRGAYLHG